MLSLVEANVKRQATGQPTVNYLGENGSATPDCGPAAVYTLEGGQLESNGLFYSTNPGVPYQMFQPSSTIGGISTGFTFTDNLNWENSAFARNPAVFCVSGGAVYVIFQDVTIPNCQAVELSLITSNDGKCYVPITISSN